MVDLFGPFSFSTGVVRNRSLGYLLATKDELVKEDIPHTRVYYRYNGTWYGIDLAWTANSGSVTHFPDERFICTGENGLAQIIGGGASNQESICPGPVMLREIRGIAGGKAYAVGTRRQAYRRDGPNKWVCIDETAQTEGKNLAETSFESIDGFSEKDIYTVGWDGEIWRYDGKAWHQVKSPTELALYKVRCGGDGYVYACGQVGTLLRGKGDEWSIINHGATKEDLWGMEWFNNKLYVSSTHFVYELQNDKLTPVGFGDQPPKSCYHLSAADGIMWSIGAKDVMEFDGKNWSRVV